MYYLNYNQYIVVVSRVLFLFFENFDDLCVRRKVPGANLGAKTGAKSHLGRWNRCPRLKARFEALAVCLNITAVQKYALHTHWNRQSSAVK